MDLDPKGINNQIKEAIDKRYVTEEDDSLVHFNETGNVANNTYMFSCYEEGQNAGIMGFEVRKPVFGGLQTTKTQTSLRIQAV